MNNSNSKMDYKRLKVIHNDGTEGPKAPPPTPLSSMKVDKLSLTPTCRIIFTVYGFLCKVILHYIIPL